MKSINISKICGSIAMAFVMMTSCAPDAPIVEDVKPVFPEIVENNNVMPGEELTLTFVPNLDWKVSIPQESIKWFSIIDGTFETDYISGKASEEAVEVKVKVAEIEEFSTSRTCEVMMEMGGETVVIARYTRQAKERSIAVYSAKIEEGTFAFASEGGYAYNEQKAEAIELLWPEGTNGFRMPVKVNSNFPWIVSFPEWAEANIPENTVGEHTFDIVGIPSKYPLEGGSGKVVFKDGETVVLEIPITIPACLDKLDFTLGGGATSIAFNGDGDYAVSVGFEAGPAHGTVFGPQGVKILAVDKTATGYGTSEASWVHAKIADWDNTGNVLQTRDVAFSVDVNEGEPREAVVFVLPATFNGGVSDLFSGSEIAEAYRSNCFSLTQDKVSTEFLTPISSLSAREYVGFYLNTILGGSILEAFGTTEFGYKITYSVAWSLDEGWMYMKKPFSTFKVFDEDKKEQTSGDFWLSLEYTENQRSIRVAMRTETAKEGYIALYDSAGNTLCVLRCIFDPTQAPVGGTDTKIELIGEYAGYAEMVGASLTEITSGELFDSWKEYGAPIYRLRYEVDNMPMKITLPKGTVYYMTNPYAKRNNFRVNDLDYDTHAGSFSYIDGGVDIYMSLDESNPESLVNEGVILFSSEKFNTTDKVTLVLLCTLDMSQK